MLLVDVQGSHPAVIRGHQAVRYRLRLGCGFFRTLQDSSEIEPLSSLFSVPEWNFESAGREFESLRARQLLQFRSVFMVRRDRGSAAIFPVPPYLLRHFHTKT